MSSQQKRQLAEIAESIATEDPDLARALSQHRPRGHATGRRRRWWRPAIAGLILVALMGVGLALLAVGLHTGDTAPTAAGAVIVTLMPMAQMLLLLQRQ